MNILFRVDCNKKNGLGHFTRCYSLANNLIKKKHKIFFLLINYENLLFIKQNKIFFIKKKIKDNNYLKDALITNKFLKEKKIDILVLDSFYLGHKWCSQVINNVKKLVIIDEGFKKIKGNIVYIDHTRNFIKKSNCYFGNKYFILNEKYLYLKKKKIFSYDIFINFGSGPFKLFLKTLLNLIESFKIYVKIVVIDNNLNLKLKKYNYLNINLIKNNNFLGNYINDSKICIGSGGMNLFERIFLKKKNLFFSTAKFQERICKKLCKQKKIIYLDKLNNKNISKNKDKIFKEILNKSKKIEKNYFFIDGKGTKRISKLILT